MNDIRSPLTLVYQSNVEFYSNCIQSIADGLVALAQSVKQAVSNAFTYITYCVYGQAAEREDEVELQAISEIGYQKDPSIGPLKFFGQFTTADLMHNEVQILSRKEWAQFLKELSDMKSAETNASEAQIVEQQTQTTEKTTKVTTPFLQPLEQTNGPQRIPNPLSSSTPLVPQCQTTLSAPKATALAQTSIKIGPASITMSQFQEFGKQLLKHIDQATALSPTALEQFYFHCAMQTPEGMIKISLPGPALKQMANLFILPIGQEEEKALLFRPSFQGNTPSFSKVLSLFAKHSSFSPHPFELGTKASQSIQESMQGNSKTLFLLGQPSRKNLTQNIGMTGIEENAAKPVATFSKPFLRASLYRAQDDFVNLDSARQSKIGPNEEPHSRVEKSDSEGRFSKVAASPNSQNLTQRGITQPSQNKGSKIKQSEITSTPNHLSEFVAEQMQTEEKSTSAAETKKSSVLSSIPDPSLSKKTVSDVETISWGALYAIAQKKQILTIKAEQKQKPTYVPSIPSSSSGSWWKTLWGTTDNEDLINGMNFM